ncbi:DUF4136 domain-containing protein [Novosphingobium sp. Gsoil 351]|uniref:DUF4136 domain-containing protein n=1 Tax=Novosphingobium sp. Gsoil 351 TaxID=2675225 RepID=UPI0012B497F2|nr:DUF4136 domain-containing protein [Novosphingobium sp. Gsoil 351]QGN54848.1 DUF4136 domain-containing protein [Novosphingobium sp. Gsoil 351]
MRSPSYSPLRRIGLIAAPLLLAGLAACATPFNANVKRFSSAMPAPQGQTFAVVAEDPRDSGGLEFGQYADLVAAQMSRLGYVRSDPSHAAMIVRLDYGVDNGRDRVRSTGFSDPFWSPWYGSRFGYGGGFGYSRFGYGGFSPYYHRGLWGYGWQDPFFFGSGYGDVDVVTVYTSELDLKIDSRADGRRLFEGKAQAASRSDRLGYLVPNLVEAVFTDFPGRSGETVRISIAPEDGKKSIKPIRDKDFERPRY